MDFLLVLPDSFTCLLVLEIMEERLNTKAFKHMIIVQLTAVNRLLIARVFFARRSRGRYFLFL